ncbi:MAG: putative viral replication protein [Circoviridae sp.]|nr:MAG: putative viral replication protein [Circoviridae sp.]
MLQKLPGNTNRQQVRNICFTVNNPSLPLAGFVDSLTSSGLPTYFVIGEEVGACGTPHFQGYIEFKQSVGWKRAHKLLLNGHMETRKGNPQQASEYCKKDNKFIEWGKISNQGHRSDIEDVANAVIAGSTLLEIAMGYPVQFIKFFKGIMALQAKLIKPRCSAPTVKVFWGSTGTGKSFRAREWLPNAYVWHPQMGQWFDGYQGEDEVLFEEFRGQLPFGMLLSLLDQYCCKVQYKGGIIEFAPTKIALTSPVHWSEWYTNLDDWDKIEQLKRRVTECVHCTRPTAS